jgi:hypothetical protein
VQVDLTGAIPSPDRNIGVIDVSSDEECYEGLVDANNWCFPPKDPPKDPPRSVEAAAAPSRLDIAKRKRSVEDVSRCPVTPKGAKMFVSIDTFPYESLCCMVCCTCIH